MNQNMAWVGLLVCGFALQWSVPAHALQVAFLEVRAPDGSPVVLEPGGRFAHVAISHASGWLHAHPSTGVAWTPSLESFGIVSVVLHDDTAPELSHEAVLKLLRMPYDFEFSWSDRAYYCSELVAKLLSMPPTPMDFSGERWKRGDADDLPRGEPGVSPDEVYRWLAAQAGWSPRSLNH